MRTPGGEGACSEDPTPVPHDTGGPSTGQGAPPSSGGGEPKDPFLGLKAGCKSSSYHKIKVIISTNGNRSYSLIHLEVNL